MRVRWYSSSSAGESRWPRRGVVLRRAKVSGSWLGWTTLRDAGQGGSPQRIDEGTEPRRLRSVQAAKGKSRGHGCTARRNRVAGGMGSKRCEAQRGHSAPCVSEGTAQLGPRGGHRHLSQQTPSPVRFSCQHLLPTPPQAGPHRLSLRRGDTCWHGCPRGIV